MLILLFLLNLVCDAADMNAPVVEKKVIHATTILKRKFDDLSMEIAVRELNSLGKHSYFYARDAKLTQKTIILHGQEAKEHFVRLNKSSSPTN